MAIILNEREFKILYPVYRVLRVLTYPMMLFDACCSSIFAGICEGLQHVHIAFFALRIPLVFFMLIWFAIYLPVCVLGFLARKISVLRPVLFVVAFPGIVVGMTALLCLSSYADAKVLVRRPCDEMLKRLDWLLGFPYRSSTFLRDLAFVQDECHFFHPIAGLLAQVAKADGRVSHYEKLEAFSFFAELCSRDESANSCIDSFDKAVASEKPLRHYTRPIAKNFSSASCLQIYEVAWKVAVADGFFDSRKDQILENLIQELNLVKGDYDECRNMFLRKNANA